MENKDFIQKAKNLQAVIRIGKNGINDNVIKEIKKLLSKKKLIKVKILRSCPISDREKLIRDSADLTESELIKKIGNTFVLLKKKNKSIVL